MISNALKFALLLAFVLIIIGGLHAAYLQANQIAVPWNKLILCYAVNYLMALGIYIALLQLAAQKSPYLGFIFLFGSALKFVVYFLIFDPLFKQDGHLSSYEFFLFFIPYMTSLIAEITALSNLLKGVR